MSEFDKNLHPMLPRRLAAMVYDTLLVLPLIMASVGLSMGIRALIFGGGEGGQPALHPQVVQLIALIAVTVFFSWFWLRSGQTLGMQAWRIKLISFDDRPITARQTIVRCLGAALSVLCLGLGYFWCLFDPRRRCWHDYLSKTELILLPKSEGKKKKEKGKETGP